MDKHTCKPLLLCVILCLYLFVFFIHYINMSTILSPAHDRTNARSCGTSQERTSYAQFRVYDALIDFVDAVQRSPIPSRS